jgi:hypothetical protein
MDSLPGPERVFRVTATADGFLTATVNPNGTTFNSGLYIMSDCVSAPLSCDSDETFDVVGGEIVSRRVAAGDSYYVAVDNSALADPGSFVLDLDLSTGHDCADPIPVPIPYEGRSQGLYGPLADADGNDVAPTCVKTDGGADVVYALTPGFSGSLMMSVLQTDFTPILYVQNACGSGNAPLVCDDGANAAGNIAVSAGSTYFAWIQANDTSSEGDYYFYSQ